MMNQGQGNVEAIHIIADGKSYYGIQAANGRYYDKQGDCLLYTSRCV